MKYLEFMKSLYAYFSKPLPKADSARIWKEEIGGYPTEFYEWAYSVLKNREKKFPDSPPFAVKELWREWLRRNPDKLERREFSCRQLKCESGFLFVWKEHSFVFRCRECDSQQEHQRIPIRTWDQLENDGYAHNSAKGTLERMPVFDRNKWMGKLTPIGVIGAKI